MVIKQISIFLENKPGQLSAICRGLAEAKINITTLSLADTNDFGIVRMIVDDCERAKEALSQQGRVVNVREVVAVGVPDSPGGMADVMKVIDEAGVNVEYSYAFAFHKGKEAALVFRFSDNEKAIEALKKSGYALLSEKEVLEAAI